MSKKSEVAILNKTRSLIARGWCQDSWARDKKGLPTEEYGDKAVSWCLQAAIYRAARDAGHNAYPAVQIVKEILSKIPTAEGKSLLEWNDTPGRLKKEVIALLDVCLQKVGRAKGRPTTSEVKGSQ